MNRLWIRSSTYVASCVAVSLAATSLLSNQQAPAGMSGKPSSFKGKTIVITGGGGTFGRTGAMHFAREGAKVVLLDFNDKALQESIAAVKEQLGEVEVHGFLCDVTDEQAVDRAVGLASATCGRISFLWNNAGYQGDMKPVLEYSSRDFHRVMNINVVGAFNVLKSVSTRMARDGNGGVIVNTGSVAGLRGTPTMCAYVASKAGIHGLTMTAAKDLAPYNIRVNTISPALIGPENGFMWKRQNDLHAASGSPYFSRDPDTVARNKVNGVPMKRLGTVEEVVKAVAFLLSDESSYITGTNMVVAGGMA